MKNIKISFKNFWNIDYTSDVTLMFIKHYFSINGFSVEIDQDNPDIIFYSVNTWNKGKVYIPDELYEKTQAIKILFTRENLNHYWYKPYSTKQHLFDFVLGFEEDLDKNRYKIPYYFVVGKLYDQNLTDYKTIQKNLVENLYQKNKNICLVSKNPHKLRLDLLDKFKSKNIIVDCPGKVGNNMPSIDDIPFKSLTAREKHNDIKRTFLEDYFFNICPENSWATGYTTEKLYHSMISGCIPIYWGCDKIDDGFYNKEKVFLIDKNLLNIDEVVDTTIELINNPNELLHYVGMNPFGENRMDIISDQNKKMQTIFQQIINAI